MTATIAGRSVEYEVEMFEIKTDAAEIETDHHEDLVFARVKHGGWVRADRDTETGKWSSLHFKGRDSWHEALMLELLASGYLSLKEAA